MTGRWDEVAGSGNGQARFGRDGDVEGHGCMHEYAQVTCKSLLPLLSVCQRRRRRERRWAVDKYTQGQTAVTSNNG